MLRLAARLPFLFIAGRLYGAEALGRFAYAILVVEFAAQLATIGLKRGLAEQLSRTKKDHVYVVYDGLLVALVASSLLAILLFFFPVLMFPNSEAGQIDRFLPIIIFMVAGSDIALAALAYRYDIASTVRARSIIEPWTISIAAGLYYLLWVNIDVSALPINAQDGLIISYMLSMIAAFIASIWPMTKSYGLPFGWKPHIGELIRLTRQNIPLAAADAIEWGSRRLDLAILGLFASPAIIGIYYVAQQVASLPQKLKTSFDPILGPVITRNLAEKNYAAIAKQVSQVGFWIIAAQAGIALALGITGEAVMGLVGPNFVGGTGALAFLLAAEVVAATAVVSEAALVYMARHRNLLLSLSMIILQAILSFGFILLAQYLNLPPLFQAAAVALALMLALAFASAAKATLLSRLLHARVNGWRWILVIAIPIAVITGYVFTLAPEWVELSMGVPAILFAYGFTIWRYGLTEDDRQLFKKNKAA